MNRLFKSADAFREWLSKNYSIKEEIWLRIFKKDSGKTSITYQEALDEALCFGWIDAQKKPLDEISWLQRFCPRKPRSKWSKKNTENAERLIKAKKMAPPGLLEIEAAKADGRWRSAYESPANSKLPTDFLKALNKHKKAKEFFATLNRANVYAVTYRLQTAPNPKTRKARMDRIVAMLERGEKFHK